MFWNDTLAITRLQAGGFFITSFLLGLSHDNPDLVFHWACHVIIQIHFFHWAWHMLIQIHFLLGLAHANPDSFLLGLAHANPDHFFTGRGTC